MLLATGLLLTGCGVAGGNAETADKAGSVPGDRASTSSNTGNTGTGNDTVSVDTEAQKAQETQEVIPQDIPGLGRSTRAEIPSETTQAVVVTGTDEDSSDSSLQVYERDPVAGWTPVTDPWPAHNAKRGWTEDHSQGDLRSPIGVFTLTDAGGLFDDPGTKLTYDQGPAFTASGDGFDGEPLEGSFDYVVAINYNRVPGTTPLDWTRPLGMEKGGGIWIHVDHDGPTQACVSIHRDRMRELLLLLDPEKRPVVVMGDAESLSR
ncbi:hypothetical protein [Streptomyces sp. NPDC093109]|uniref:hypothetical protein n=1 Tax=Streptomyces sp. NPDC093109 TaxID=3154977 RepID=UPI00344CC659